MLFRLHALQNRFALNDFIKPNIELSPKLSPKIRPTTIYIVNDSFPIVTLIPFSSSSKT